MRELPPNWRWCTIADVGQVSGGLTKNAKRHLLPENRPLIKVGNVYFNELRTNDVEDIGVSPSEIDRTELRPGDLLLVEGNGSIEQIGRVALWDGRVPGAVHQNHLIKVRVGPAISEKFLLWWLISPGGRKSITERASSTSGLHTLSISKVDSLPTPLPPPKEQERIVAKLEEVFSELDAGVEALNRAQIRLTRYRQSVFNAAVTGALTSEWSLAARLKGPLTYRPSQVDRPKQIPSEWAWVSFERVAQISGGLTKNKLRSEMTLRLPYLRVANVYADDLRLDEIEEIGVTEGELPRVRLQSGDLLIVEGNGSQDQIGRVANWDGSISPCVHQNHLIKARPTDVLLPRFALIWLLSPLGRTYIVEQASSTSGLFTLSISKVESLPIPVPSLAEQQRIIEEFDVRTTELDALEGTIRKSLARAKRLRESILERAFRGELVPQDPADEPAEALMARLRESTATKAGQGMSTKRSYVRKTKTAAGGA